MLAVDAVERLVGEGERLGHVEEHNARRDGGIEIRGEPSGRRMVAAAERKPVRPGAAQVTLDGEPARRPPARALRGVEDGLRRLRRVEQCGRLLEACLERRGHGPPR
jgi:hypothetical protein